LWLSALVPIDVVRVSEPAVCTLRLSVRGFTPLLDGGEKTQPWFWHFEPWFPKVLEISENTLFYIIAGSFGSGGGRGRFLYPPLVRWERDAIRPSFLPFGRLRCFVEIRSWFVHLADAETMVVQPSSQTDTGRPLLHRPLSPPPPKTPVTNWQTYWIYNVIVLSKQHSKLRFITPCPSFKND